MPIDPLLSPGVPLLLEVSHVAHRLSVSHEYVRRALREKRLRGVRLGNRWRVDPLALHAFIDAQQRDREARPSTETHRESSVHQLPHAVNR